MSIDRRLLKRAIIGLLDAIAEEHPQRHQPSKAQRYVLTSAYGAHVEIMFEKGDGPANIWCLETAAGATLIADLKPKPSPASKLRATPGQYGRHSALETMPQLGDADLVCFAPENLCDLGKIIDRLLNVTPAELI